MNETTEALFIALLRREALDTPEMLKAFDTAYDYIIEIAELDDNENEQSNAHDVLAALLKETQKAAFQAGMHAAFQLAK